MEGNGFRLAPVVLQTGKIGEPCRLAIVIRKQEPQPLIDALVDQNLHEASSNCLTS